MKKVKKFKYHQEDDFKKKNFSKNKKDKHKKNRYKEEEPDYELINNITK